MSNNDKLNSLISKIKQKNILLLLSVVYSYTWAICKIIFGVFTFSYFFCISGASTLLFGFIKKIYLTNYKSNDFNEKCGKSITISILLIISSSLFTFYMAKFFFVEDIQSYGLILSIAIATFSFAELGISIYNFTRAKDSQDILLQSFRGCNLSSSCFAIVLTQVALLSATQTSNNFFNGLTGVIMGSFAILIGIYLLIKSIQAKM